MGNGMTTDKSTINLFEFRAMGKCSIGDKIVEMSGDDIGGRKIIFISEGYIITQGGHASQLLLL